MPKASDFLTLDEVAQVVADLKKRQKRSVLSRQNLIIFRLSCCCGLRRKEIMGLNLDDVMAEGAKPAIRVRKATTKASAKTGKRRGRIVPLWWDRGTLDDLRAWVEFRRHNQMATDTDPLVCFQTKNAFGRRLEFWAVGRKWRTAIRCLGPVRVKQLHLHCGRHTFASLALQAGHSLAAVRDALGHASLSVTNIYLHAQDRPGLPDAFSLPAKPAAPGRALAG